MGRQLVAPLGQTEEILTKLPGHGIISSHHKEPPQTKQDRKHVLGVTQLLAQDVSPLVGGFNLGSRVPSDHKRCCPKRGLKRQFPLMTRQAFRQGPKQG